MLLSVIPYGNQPFSDVFPNDAFINCARQMEAKARRGEAMSNSTVILKQEPDRRSVMIVPLLVVFVQMMILFMSFM